MARIGLVDSADAGPATAELLERIAGDRGRAFNVYRALANSPGVLEHVYGLASFLWHDSVLAPALQELVILRVAQLCRSEYEWARHRPLAERAGVSEAQVEALRDPGAAPAGTFGEAELVALAVAEQATLEVEASEGAIAAACELLGDRGALELVTLVGLYGMVARVLRSLAVDPEPGDKPVL